MVPRVLTTLSPSASDAGSFDLVVASGWLENLPWDRWELQRVHSLLKADGVLVLEVPDAFSPRLLADPSYVTAKVSKQLRKLVGVPSPATEAPPGRRAYTWPRLRALLEDGGFHVIRRSHDGLEDSPGRPRLATGHVVVATKTATLYGLQPDRPYPPAADHQRRFEREHRGLLRVRDAWARRHPGFGSPSPLPFEADRHAGRTVLVLAPHPDDEIIGCGGTLLRLSRAGASVVVLHLTDGSASAALVHEPEDVRRSVRLAEALEVAQAAGFSPPIFWGEDNRLFECRPDLVSRLKETLAELRPSMVFTPFVADIHLDHRTTNRILAGALEGVEGETPEIANYEVWGFVPANRYCDVTDEMPRVEELLFRYTTAMKVDDFLRLCRDRNYEHALRLTGRAGFAEEFLTLPADVFRVIAARPVAIRRGS